MKIEKPLYLPWQLLKVMLAFGRFIAKGEVYEGYFEVEKDCIVFDGLEFRNVKFLPQSNLLRLSVSA